ncbi:MAG: KAP family NTPase [Clostridiales Family XIII bacterium]|nr:KAP family NTPase [Clostridiales Family XIII bacterium]
MTEGTVSTRNNPFTPSFGSIPPLMAGRNYLIQDILEGLDNGPGDPHRATIFVGARGSGKTALLAKIAEDAAQHGWINAKVTAIEGMLEDIIQRSQESASEFLEKNRSGKITGVGIAGLSITRTIESTPEGNWRTRMNKLLDTLDENGIGLLITVDEVNVALDEMRTLAAVFQHFISERRNVALLMAGLPHNVSAMLQDKTISFLRRAFQHHLGSIELHDVKETIKNTVELSGRSIEEQALDMATLATGGFPFLIQLIGYHIWRQHSQNEVISMEDAEDGVEYARSDMKRMIFDTTLREISDTDEKFLLAMSLDEGDSQLVDIAARLGVTSNYANQYRNRLIEQGIIGSAGRGKLKFEIPMLKEYLREKP